MDKPIPHTHIAFVRKEGSEKAMCFRAKFRGLPGNPRTATCTSAGLVDPGLHPK